MIIGHGIDLQEIDAIKRAYEKNNRFAKRVMTENELRVFEGISYHKRQIEFLAGRWSGKEVFSKAMVTGIGELGFQDIEILNHEKGAPQVTRSPFEGRVFISLSHSGNFVQASIILEEDA